MHQSIIGDVISMLLFLHGIFASCYCARIQHNNNVDTIIWAVYGLEIEFRL